MQAKTGLLSFRNCTTINIERNLCDTEFKTSVPVSAGEHHQSYSETHGLFSGARTDTPDDQERGSGTARPLVHHRREYIGDSVEAEYSII
jgi:hypothetical protein